jgi:hypothetical protein
MKLRSNLPAELIGITVFTGATPIHMKSYTEGIKSSRSNCLDRHLEWQHRGSLLFDGSATGESYLESLREVALPGLESGPLYDNTEII